MGERPISDLPVREQLPALTEALASHNCVILSAPPGSGKTTLVPLELLQQPWLQGRSIIMLQPRRLAARATASYMARQLDEAVGATVGYRVRLESRVSKQTRIEVVTEGILTRRLQSDPELKGVGLVIFDEFHERSLQSDLGLAFCLDIQQALRDDLRLLLMSATLECEAVSRLLDDAPVISGSGRSYPVELHYLGHNRELSIPQQAAHGIKRALQEQTGDILVFLPGVGEIRTLVEVLRPLAESDDILLAPLFGDLSREMQDRAILPDPAGKRRIVLATSIAETSLTIEGISSVVDSGWSRLPCFDPNSGLTRLETLRVSRAAADQRAGRAGRLAAGVCYRLWDQALQERLQPQHKAEILEADLAPLVLELARWGVTQAQQLPWLDLPPSGAFAQARELLQRLGALDGNGRITATGEAIARLPLHPRLAHMLLLAHRRGQGALACDLAALVSERDIIRRVSNGERSADIEERLKLLERWRRQGDRNARQTGVDPAACRRVDRASHQWLKLLGEAPQMAHDEMAWSPGGLLAQAYPDRIAQRRSSVGSGYLLASGRGARLSEGDGLLVAPYLVAAALDAGRTEGRIFLAAVIDQQEIEQVLADQLKQVQVIDWDRCSESVFTSMERRIGMITLSSRPLPEPDPEQVCAAMLEGIRQMGIESLPWTDEARSWRSRLLSLRVWQPDAGWPDLTDATLLSQLEEWLSPYLAGITRRDHLRRLDLLAILKSSLNWQMNARLEQLAPTHIQVPSGSRKRLYYADDGSPPVLAVKLQEMFGLADTPRICNGEIAVMLHLLSPAQRPVQVTQDLKGFWQRTYQEVKKELKGRYPKHPWPDDPWTAQATARTKPKP